MNLLEIQNLSKKYDGKKVLEDINLYLKKGTTLGLIGPTGCGKTTLIRIIDLIEKPSSGKIIFNGLEIPKNKTDQLNIRRKMGMVYQKPIVFKGTVYDNICYGLKIRGEKKEEYQDKIKDLLESLGLGGYEKRDASTLSGGETQRMALARALISDPELLLLDEPTANLDPQSTEKIENFLEKLRDEGETTVIIATHNLIQGQHLSDEIAILNKKIFQIGKPEEVFRKPKTRFVAEFVGVKNVKKGTSSKIEENLTAIDTGTLKVYASSTLEGDVYLSIRPEEITLSKLEVRTSALNEFNGEIKEIKDSGGILDLKIDVGEVFSVYMTQKSFSDMELTIGSKVWLQFKASAVNVFEV
ncbi:MAG: ABC-type spermidine/putrescine transport system, ATPase component [Methanobacterium sp. Maddingley MBC34]|nr:MAG: ABC-type spermidine/putrescine transport system, ATPase component [Methanobacterium sp. Maddingley MBC34]